MSDVGQRAETRADYISFVCKTLGTLTCWLRKVPVQGRSTLVCVPSEQLSSCVFVQLHQFPNAAKVSCSSTTTLKPVEDWVAQTAETAVGRIGGIAKRSAAVGPVGAGR